MPVEPSLRTVILTTLGSWPGRSASELRAVAPAHQAQGTAALLAELVAAGKVVARISRVSGTKRYWLAGAATEDL